MWRWEEGRLGSGYYKMCLCRMWFFDCYILKFPTGSEIKPHTDPAPDGKKHYRLNLLLPSMYTGGRFITDQQGYCGEVINFFSPSQEIHYQEKVTNGTKYQLSIGWVW